MRLKRPSHATVVAYVALFVALSGSAYAVTQIGSRQLENNSIRSQDLKNRQAVKKKDVANNTLTGAKIREETLDPAAFVAGASGSGGQCNPESTSFALCSSASLDVARQSNVFAVGSAGFFGTDGPKATCHLDIDGATVGQATLGQVDDTTGSESDGFALNGMTLAPVQSGTHTITLSCSQVDGDARFSSPEIVAFAFGV